MDVSQTTYPPNRVVSVFSGCGGLDYGFKRLGCSLVYACDNDPSAVRCYAKNLDDTIFHRDIRSPEFHDDIASIGQCDIVLGGFPCQGFSKAGPKNPSDDRNLLYREMLRTIECLQPRLFIAENVDGVSQNFGGSYLARILSDFESLSYSVEARLVEAMAFGVPQYRRRIIFVGYRRSNSRTFEWPNPTYKPQTRSGDFHVNDECPMFDAKPVRKLLPPRTIADAIGDLLEHV